MSASTKNKVFVYRNLNRKGVVWSAKSTKTGLVVERSTTIYLSNCKLKVSQAGRKRVLEQQRKNVHAGIVGTRISRMPKLEWIRVQYNPYVCDSFIRSDTSEKIEQARYVKLTKNGCFVSL